MSTIRTRKRMLKIMPDWVRNYERRKTNRVYNPQSDQLREEAKETVYSIFNYDDKGYSQKDTISEQECEAYANDNHTTWINVGGLKKNEVESLCRIYQVHPLAVEDILSSGQRAKMDEIGTVIFCLIPMFFYNGETGQIDREQISIVLGSDFVLSFQENPRNDIFDPVRQRLIKAIGKPGKTFPDFLCYCIIDLIVDSYFSIIEKLNNHIEDLEDDMFRNREKAAMAQISIMRREVMNLHRNIMPVRDLVYGFVRSEHEILHEQHNKYFKDVSDHITQANEYVDGQRETLISIQDLLMSQINLKMNEVMKAFTMVATLLAPATVIGGIFGMNFDYIPFAKTTYGFIFTVAVMLVIPITMLLFFRKKGWL